MKILTIPIKNKFSIYILIYPNTFVDVEVLYKHPIFCANNDESNNNNTYTSRHVSFLTSSTTFWM